MFVNVVPGETRIALVQSGRLVSLNIARASQECRIGSIYLGRVIQVVPSLNAAFVDIGLTRPGILNAGDAATNKSARPARISSLVREGDALLNQIVREPVGDKGPRLSARISIAGRNLTYIPSGDGVIRHREATDDDRWAPLENGLTSLGDEFGGVVVRERAQEADTDHLISEATALCKFWSIHLARSQQHDPPRLIVNAAAPVDAAIRDWGEPDWTRIVVDDRRLAEDARKACQRHLPQLTDRVEHYDSSEPLFEHEEIEEQIDAALASEVSLPSGGSIIIEETASVVAIDVNSGHGAIRRNYNEYAAATNEEAAAEIVRQIDLRNLAGRIVIDFIPTRQRAGRNRVLRTLRDGFEADNVESFIGGYTKLGLVELNRQRNGESLAHYLVGAVESLARRRTAKSPESISYDVIRVILKESRYAVMGSFVVIASTRLTRVIEELLSDLRTDLERRVGTIAVRQDPAFGPDEFVIHADHRPN